MNIRFWAIICIICLLFAGCGDSKKPETNGTTAPGETTDTTNAPSDPSEGGESTGDEELDLTFPFTFPDETLPIDFFDDVEGVVTSRPLEPTEANPTEPSEPENVNSGTTPDQQDPYVGGDTLPVDWWD